MNLKIIEQVILNCLGRPQEFVEKQLKDLLKRVQDYQEQEENVEDHIRFFHTLDIWTKAYYTAQNEWTVKEATITLKEKIDILNRILGLQGQLNSQLTYILCKEEMLEKLSVQKKYRNTKRDLYSFKEELKENGFRYKEIIRSLIEFQKSEIKARELRIKEIELSYIIFVVDFFKNI